MAYERIDGPKGLLYHYTKRENIEPILQDGRIRKFRMLVLHFLGGYLKTDGVNGHGRRKTLL